MPVTANQLTSGGTGSPGSTNATASITTAAGKLVLVSVSSDTNAVLPTVSGLGMTWTQVSTSSGGTNNMDVTLFRGLSLSSHTGALSIDFSDTGSLSAVAWSVTEFGNIDQSGSNGANAIVQSATSDSTSATSITVTLSAFGSSDNATYGTMGINGTNTITEGSGFTELAETSASTRTLEAQWKNSNDTSVDWSWTGSQAVGSIGIEIKYSPVDLTKQTGFLAFM